MSCMLYQITYIHSSCFDSVKTLIMQLSLIQRGRYHLAYLSVQLKALGSHSDTWKLTCLCSRGCSDFWLWRREKYPAASVIQWSSSVLGEQTKEPFCGGSVWTQLTVSCVCGWAGWPVWVYMSARRTVSLHAANFDAGLSVSVCKPWVCPLWVSLNSVISTAS